MKNLNFLLGLSLLMSPMFSDAQTYTIPQAVQASDVVPGEMILKYKESYRSLINTHPSEIPALKSIIDQLDVTSAQKIFTHLDKPRKETNSSGKKLTDLSLILSLKYQSNKDFREVAMLLNKTGLFEWVQPRFVHKPMFTPNDPQIAQQYHHALIKSFEAFDIEEGDTNVFIGITDAGIQFDHQDLGNVRFNYADPVNGIDDDNNGYIDDFRGWNTVNNTNDPTATLSPHGMFTTGMSSATVNNGIGIAGNAYRCKFVPVRIDDANGFNFGYEGIVYLSDLGCKIINASWGNTFPSPFAEEVIQYAINNNDALIIAAAGNSGLNENYYPASYDGVMSVGATGSADLAWSLTTYGPMLDIVAPGELVRSCWPFNGYDISSGTSFSAPLVAGAAALVKSHFPTYTAQQIAERLRVTADTSIYTLPGNDNRYHLLGSGRLNTLRALNDPEIPSVRYRNYQFASNGNPFIIAGDTMLLTGDFLNYLSATNNLTVQLSTENPAIEILQGTVNAGTIATLQSVSNNATPFEIRVLPNAPINADVIFKLTYSDPLTNYSAFEYISVRVNKDYMDLSVNNLHTTITSRGSIGYNADYATDGLGISFNNSGSQIYASGFMLGSGGQVADNVYAEVIPGYDNNFTRIDAVREIENSSSGDKEIVSKFSTNAAGSQPLSVRQRAYASSEGELANHVVIEYTVKNIGNAVASDVFGGIFTDWDIQNSGSNVCTWDAARKMVYAYDASQNNRYMAVKLLSWQDGSAYCFNSDGAGGSINLYNGFSNQEKFNVLSGSAVRNSSNAGDVAASISTWGETIAPGDSALYAFAILGGNSLLELQEAASKAQSMWNLNQMQLALQVNAESCAENDGSIDLSVGQPGTAQLLLFNGDGVELTGQDIVESSFIYEGMPAGDYTLAFDFFDGTSEEVGFTIENSDPVSITELTASSEIVVLPDATVDFSIVSDGATDFLWDFGDGNTSTDENPSYTFTESGTYTVTCTASNDNCSETSTLTIEVGTTVSIRDLNDAFVIYPNPAQEILNVNLGNSLEAELISLIDLSGRTVAEVSKSNQISVSHLANGTYFVRVMSEGKQWMKKIQVIR
jgi:serine protease